MATDSRETKGWVVTAVCDSNYLSRCASMLESGRAGNSAHILALDSSATRLRDWFSKIEVSEFGSLMRAKPELLEQISTRSKSEQIFSACPSFLLDQHEFVKPDGWLVYADSDLFFFQSLQDYLGALPHCNIVIAPHRHHWWNRRRLAKYGYFNVGLVAFRNNEQGLRALRYWAESCLEWCYDRPENGKYADQKYLEHFSTVADGVFVDQSLGANLAPWNAFLKRITATKSGDLLVNGDRLAYFHAQGIKLSRGRWVLGHLNYLSLAGKGLKKFVYRPYLEKLEHWSAKPGFEAYGTSRIPTTRIRRLAASLIYFSSVMTGQTIKRKLKLGGGPHDSLE